MAEPCITIDNLTMAYGDFVIQRDLNFTINRGDVFIVMGGNGCGKTTLLRHMIGLQSPARGDVYYGDEGLWRSDSATRQRILRRTGVMFQSGALLSSMTLAENVALPITEATRLPANKVREIVSYKLALVGLAGFEDYYPSELSGGMQKRAGLARAMALDPEILFFDEPSAGLDPITAKLLDDLILSLSQSLSVTVVVVTHDLDSIFAIGNNSVFLDAESRSMIAGGPPRQLLAESKDPKLVRFLTRGNPSDRNIETRQMRSRA
ncbi:MAG: ATP-binding cassette domain-containing protein [Methylococcaceae bacterium]|nr:ATP-binding cassette domain-containing protein [Methylococcaceae bacterium]